MSKIFSPIIMSRQSTGLLIVDVKTLTPTGALIPVPGASVIIMEAQPVSGSVGAVNTIATQKTNAVGQTEPLPLDTPPFDLSQTPSAFIRPYSTYSVEVIAEGFERVFIGGVQIFPGIRSILPVFLTPTVSRQILSISTDVVVIGPATLYGDYPPKIPESPIKDVSASDFVVLDEVVVPEFVVVHDGSPNNAAAPNYTIPYKDYIKNVASSEIYPTWSRDTIIANVVAITSFTLNRIYTEWYRNQRKDFTITSSTAFDHAFFLGRDIFDTISEAVDEVFNIYMKLPNVTQPLLSQYCDGAKVQCPNWMSQWGSKALGDDGVDAPAILKFYYGEEIEFEEADTIEGIPESYPGTPLKLGDSGSDVRKIQEQLNRISDNYPLIPKVRSTGDFDEATEEAVKVFQQVFYLTPDGIVGKDTWYKISEIFVAVTKIAELP